MLITQADVLKKKILLKKNNSANENKELLKNVMMFGMELKTKLTT